jgi:hypothetical protein
MKFLITPAFLLLTLAGQSQNLQFHYDFRHTIEPELNSVNYPTFSFEYFKNIDTLDSGSFLMKFQADLNGKDNNIGQVYTQISQSLKFWDPGIYLSVTYSGGLGVTPTLSGYYITNSLGVGPAFPFQWKGAWISTGIYMRINFFPEPSYDPMATIYFGKGFFNYRIFSGGSFTFWTENKNRGTEFTGDLRGKKFCFYGDPQIWFKIEKKLSLGSRINVYYHLLTDDNKLQAYPTFGIRYEF